MLLAAIAYNLKKLLRYRPERTLRVAIAFPTPPTPPLGRLFWLRTRHKLAKKANQ